jgi:hypothetical protein
MTDAVMGRLVERSIFKQKSSAVVEMGEFGAISTLVNSIFVVRE